MHLGDPVGRGVLIAAPTADAALPIGKLTAELLPVVGEEITGSPVIDPAECSGVGRVAVGAIPDAGLGNPAEAMTEVGRANPPLHSACGSG